MKKIITCALFLLIPFFITTIAWAEFKMTPSISIREEYNDNIFLTPADEEDDFITSIYPSINLIYNINLLTLSLDYGLYFRFYADHSELNDTGLSETQRARFETTINPYKDIIFIKVFDEYQRISIDERQEIALDNPFVNMTDSNRFLINPYIEYPLSGTLKTRVSYTYENLWYKEEIGDNTTIHIFAAGLTKELSSRISASFSYAYFIHQAEETEDWNRHDASVGMNYQVTQKLSLAGSFGRSWFDYKDRADDFDFWNTSANYQLTDRIFLTGGYSRSFLNSVNVGTYKSDAVRVSLTRQGDIPVTVSVFKQKGVYLSEDREDKSTGVTVSAGYLITPRMTGRLTGFYTDYDFLPDKEQVKRYGASLSFDYAIRITTISAGYTHNDSNSTVNRNDYKNNVIWMQARFTI